ncbi:MAG: global cell cycle regulator GcrA-like protein [Alphaproteobacteria bacterium]|nr:global cell cycle regulator GcrA-like protein [Alphaproteobacteria bacterium]
MGWTNEQVEQLRQMWVEGLTANEIAKRLGVTKNAIVGKVHRLCLKARPSPIKNKNAKDEAAEVAATEEENVETATAVETVEIVAEEDVVCKPQPAAVRVHNGNVKLTELDSHTCRWPIGDPRDDDFCFCGKKVRAGQTYCDEHSAMAYVKANRSR